MRFFAVEFEYFFFQFDLFAYERIQQQNGIIIIANHFDGAECTLYFSTPETFHVRAFKVQGNLYTLATE